jgi:hypothetical protein
VLVAIPGVAPRSEVAVTRVAADGTMQLTEELPVYNGIATVAMRDDTSALIVRVAGAAMSMPVRVDIPPEGELRAATLNSGASTSIRCQCAMWRPSVPAGLVLFGVLPFALSYLVVRRFGRK